MIAETLTVNLDRRIAASPRFHDRTVGAYFRKSRLKWWHPESPAHHAQEKDIKKWLEDYHLRNVLEIGPGFGRITHLIAPHAQQLTLVEINERAAKSLVTTFPTAHVINDAVEKYELWQDGYDLIVAIAVLMHIPNIPSLLSMIAGSLVHGGRLMTSIVPLSYYKSNRTIIHRGIDPEEFEHAVSQQGLSIEKRTRHRQILTYNVVK